MGYFATFSSMMFYCAFQGFQVTDTLIVNCHHLLTIISLQVGNNIWLSKWSDDPLATSSEAVRNKYLSVYGVLGFLQGIFVMLGALSLALSTLNAASKLHQSMLMRILRSPMSFFDTTPLGRILSRFSKDIDIVDTMIPMNMRMLLTTGLSVLGTVVAIVFAMPQFLAIILPVAALYYFVQRFYVAAARQVKRMESITRQSGALSLVQICINTVL